MGRVATTGRSTSSPPRGWDEAAHLRRIFNLLVLYRWLSLLPPLIFHFSAAPPAGQLGALPAAAFSNLLITLIPTRLNQLLRRQPALIGVDLAFGAALLALSGGWRSPYYLFVISPLLASAFFFRLRGALAAAAAFVPMYALAVGAAIRLGGPPPDGQALSLAVVGFFLVTGIFGYAATLLARVRLAHDDLGRVHRELEIIHDLTVSLQNAPEVREVQERVLDAVTRELGFRRAIVGLMDQPYMILSHWRDQTRDAAEPSAERPAPAEARWPVEPGGGPLAEAILDNDIRMRQAGEGLTNDPAFDARLALHGSVLIAPMALREHPIGVLLVETDGAAATPANLASLRAIASQAAVALGTTMLCIDRAQRLAIQEERMRFAREMHDTLSQSLFGIVYALDGLVKLLPDRPDVVKSELEEIKQVAEDTRAQVRQSILDIWPSALTAESFQNDLRRFVAQFCRQDELRLDISVRGDFALLSPRRQRGLYRIAQEALTNVAKHAQAGHAEVRLEVGDGRAQLVVRDDGRGFDPDAALARERDREHFGLKGMQERASALGGAFVIESQSGSGASVTVTIPTETLAAEEV
jgi:signal transduction histidine kinase